MPAAAPPGSGPTTPTPPAGAAPAPAPVPAPVPTRTPWRHHLRRLWRTTLRDRWQEIRAPLLLGVGVLSLVLGTIGYLQLKSVTPRYGFLDALYRAVTLFAFGGTAPPPIPWTLQIARIAAPVLTGYAALGTVLALTRTQARVLGIRLFMHDHVIIAGLGETGARLAAALVDRIPVVVIESDVRNVQVTGARLRGVSVLGGDAADASVLRQAGLRKARTLVVTCGSGAVNVDVASAAISSLPRRRRPLRIFAALDNIDLWSSLAAEGATFAEQRKDVRLEYFNVQSIAAQLMVERRPPFAPGGLESAHVLVVGIEGIGEQLVLALARLVASERRETGTAEGEPDQAAGAPDTAGDGAPAEEKRLQLSITGAHAEADVEGLLARYPALPGYLELSARRYPIDSAAFQGGAAMVSVGDTPDITYAYVTLVDEAEGLQAALALHARVDTSGVPVTVAVVDATAGVSEILGSDRGRLRGISAFGAISEATNQRLLLRGVNELIARAQHVQWMRSMQRTDGEQAALNPNFKPWDQLSEEQREFNRRFADDVHTKLERVHCMIVPVPLPDPTGHMVSFTDDEVELLAREEHQRWLDQRTRDGWTWGPERNDEHKIHPLLVPYDDLDEPTKEKDRAAVREIPVTLATAGFAIRRA